MLKVYSTKNKNSSGFLHEALELRSSVHMSWRFAQGETWMVETPQWENLEAIRQASLCPVRALLCWENAAAVFLVQSKNKLPPPFLAARIGFMGAIAKTRCEVQWGRVWRADMVPPHPVWGAKGSCATWSIRKCQRVLYQSHSSLWRFRNCKEQIVINKSKPWALALVNQIRNCGAGTVVLGFITRAFSAVALSDLSQRVAVDDLYLCELNWTIRKV